MTTVSAEASRSAAPATRPTLGTTTPTGPARGLLNFKETPDELSRTPLRASRDGLRKVAETPDPIQIHARAINSLAMALHYLRQPESNVPGASRKAVQALAAINALRFAGRGEAANDGRA